MDKILTPQEIHRKFCYDENGSYKGDESLYEAMRFYAKQQIVEANNQSGGAVVRRRWHKCPECNGGGTVLSDITDDCSMHMCVLCGGKGKILY